MTVTTIHGRQIRDTTIADGKLVYQPIRQNGTIAFTGDQSFGTFKATNVGDPASAQDAATKAYVDNLLLGLKWKAPARVATTANGTLATAFANGQTVDGVTLATGDRILIKNQSDATANGIYVVAASGAPTRATDADGNTELINATLLVSEGTANADSQWTCTNDTMDIGTTEIAFVRIGSGAAAQINVDSEVPTGTINGSNADFTLAQTPATGSLHLYLNGVRQIAGGVDYTLATNTITYVSAPVTGDTHIADYRY